MTDNRTNEQIILESDTALADAVNPEEQARVLLAALRVAGRLAEPKQTKAKSSQDFVFSEAQVEAAAKALYCTVRGIEVQDFEWPELSGADRYRAEARAALVAAQGAAPQLIGRLDLARHYWRSLGYDYDLHGLDGNNDYGMGLAVADAALAALAAAQGAGKENDR